MRLVIELKAKSVKRNSEALPIGILNKLEELRKLFKKDPRIIAAYLFGSYSRGEEGALSDIDIAIALKEGLSLDEEAELVSKVSLVLESDNIDVAFLDNDASILLKERVIEGRAIYSKSEKERIRFEHSVMSDYLFFSPFNAIYDKYLVEKVEGGAR